MLSDRENGMLPLLLNEGTNSFPQEEVADLRCDNIRHSYAYAHHSPCIVYFPITGKEIRFFHVGDRKGVGVGILTCVINIII
jgi:hypothetical protein